MDLSGVYPPIPTPFVEAAAELGCALDALGMLTKVGMPVAPPVAPEVQQVGKTERERC